MCGRPRAAPLALGVGMWITTVVWQRQDASQQRLLYWSLVPADIVDLPLGCPLCGTKRMWEARRLRAWGAGAQQVSDVHYCAVRLEQR